MKTPITQKTDEMNKEYNELGFTLNQTNNELRMMINDYFEEKRLCLHISEKEVKKNE